MCEREREGGRQDFGTNVKWCVCVCVCVCEREREGGRQDFGTNVIWCVWVCVCVRACVGPRVRTHIFLFFVSVVCVLSVRVRACERVYVCVRVCVSVRVCVPRVCVYACV